RDVAERAVRAARPICDDRADARSLRDGDPLCGGVRDPITGVAAPADAVVVRRPPGALPEGKRIGVTALRHPRKEWRERGRGQCDRDGGDRTADEHWEK